MVVKLKATEHIFQSKVNNLWSKLGQVCLTILSWGAKTVTYYTVHNQLPAYLVPTSFFTFPPDVSQDMWCFQVWKEDENTSFEMFFFVRVHNA